jgi:carotenoid cleavage dioxygenase
VTGRPHRYIYSVAHVVGEHALEPSGTLLKYDSHRQTSESKDFGPTCALDEFVFVPDPSSTSEDRGVLLGYVWNSALSESSLCVIDASTLDEVAVVRLPERVPHGFHGSWIADAKFNAPSGAQSSVSRS